MKNNNWKKNTVDRFNTDKKRQQKNYKPKEEKMKGTSISVWNGDVNGALRKLKKILERADRQKELSKREFYEKPSAKRKRLKNQAKKRWAKEVWDNQMKGNMPIPSPVDQKHLKTKKKRRKEFLRQEMVRRMRKKY